jgi:hypothetical protein
MPRIKTVSLGDDQYKISPLALGEAEAWEEARKALQEIEPEDASDDATKEEKEDKAKQKIQWLKSMRENHLKHVVCIGLNKAMNGSGELPWTPERCHAEMDIGLFNFLFKEIMYFSELAERPKAEGVPQGENQAP